MEEKNGTTDSLQFEIILIDLKRWWFDIFKVQKEVSHHRWKQCAILVNCIIQFGHALTVLFACLVNVKCCYIHEFQVLFIY